LERKFDFDVVILPCQNPEDFRVSIGEEHIKDLRANAEASLNKVVEGALKDTASRIVKTVGHMAERLTEYKPGDEGERATGTFRDSLVENVRELAELLPAFNLTNDPKLTAVTKKINSQLIKHDAAQLREDEVLRKKLAKTADEIVKEVSAFL
jgi:hypothetical protein